MNYDPIASRIQIRYASPADNQLLAELGASTFFETFGAQNTPENMAAYLAESFSPQKQAAELADPDSVFLIAEIGGSPAGYARLHQGDPLPGIRGQRPLEIVRIYSTHEWIGRGVGSALMQACLDEALRRGCDTAWLDVWEENPRAIAFYRKWGFELAGTNTFKLGDDLQHDLLMQRPVQFGLTEQIQEVFHTDKPQSLKILREEFNRWEELLAGLDEAQLTAPFLPGGWSIKNVLAHLMAWQQRTAARLSAAHLDRAPEFPDWLSGIDPEADSDETTNQINAWIYATHRDRPWPEVYLDWRTGYLKCIELSEAIPASDLQAPGRFPWMDGYALADILMGTYEHHHIDHFEPLLAWLRRPA